MRSSKGLVVLGLAILAAQGSKCGPNAPPAATQTVAPAATLSLQVYLDGGYLFDFSPTDAVAVHSLASGKLPMKARVLTSGNQEIDFAGMTASFRPDGNAPTPAKPGIPPLDEAATGCSDDDLHAMKRNNRLFIPNLDEVAAGMDTEVKKDAKQGATLRLTGGGDVSVDSLGGCVEFRKKDNSPYKPKRSMASGIEGILYQWDVAANSITLVTKTEAGAETETKLYPNAKRIIAIRISSFATYPKPQTPPYKIEHFKTHFDDAFKSLDETKRLSLWWLGTYLTSPGIDCPPGSTGS